jgi:hypothetical protein
MNHSGNLQAPIPLTDSRGSEAVERGLCAFHSDPKRAAQLGRIGGRKNRRCVRHSEIVPMRPPQTAKEMKEALADALAGVQAGRLEPRIRSVMAYVGTAFLRALETTDLEECLSTLSRCTSKK